MLMLAQRIFEAMRWAQDLDHTEYAHTVPRLRMAGLAVQRGDLVVRDIFNPSAPWSSAVLACEDAGWPIVLTEEEEPIEALITEAAVFGAIRKGHRTVEGIARHIGPENEAGRRFVEMQLRRLVGIGRLRVGTVDSAEQSHHSVEEVSSC